MRIPRFSPLKRALRRTWLLVALLAVANRVEAEHLPIKVYTTVDGLANNSINKIVRDPRGFLWFCTSDGLSRFDGYTFTNYGTNQGLPHRNIADLLVTRDGEYWVATDAGLVRFNPKAPPDTRVTYTNQAGAGHVPMFSVVVPEDEGAYAKAITVLLEDHEGTIWCGTYDGIFRLDRSENRFELHRVGIGMADQPEGHIVSDLLEDRAGLLWVASPSGLYLVRPGGPSVRYTKNDGLPDDYLHSLLQDHEGGLWVGSRYGGFFQISIDDSRQSPVIPRAISNREGMQSPWVFQLFEGSGGRFWVATAHGLLEFFPNRDEQGRWVRSYTEKNGLSFYDITTVNEDLAGNLWLGTNSAGVMKLENNGFITYDTRDGIYSISSVFGDRPGGICLRGSVTGDARTSVFEGATLDPLGRTPDYHYTRLGRFDGQRFTWFMPHGPSDLGWMNEGTTLQTRDGEAWIGTSGALYRYPATDTFDQIRTAQPLAVYTKEDGLGGNPPYRLYEDVHGNVWVSAWSNTPLLMWDRSTHKMQNMTGVAGRPDEAPHSFGEDHAGNLWLGFVGKLGRYRDGSLTTFTESEGVPPGAITSIYADHAGRLWLTSARNGLIRVDNPAAERPTFVSYTTAEGLSSNSTDIFASQLIVEDLQGHIYVGTERGLDRLDPATGHFKHFTYADGLAPGGFKACFRDRDGGLWFGMTRGLSHFVPPQDEAPMAPPPILISGLQVAGSRQFVGALGETDLLVPDLTSSQNQLQIDFIGLSFTPGEVLHYEYQLQGFDADWNPPTEQRSVTYRLAPGRYKFLVRAVNSDGVVSAAPAAISFRILPPVWLRWWFLSLVAIALALVLYRFYLYRVGRLLELERVRTRIATDLHDDIGSSLSRMAILSEVAKRQLEGAGNGSVSILSEIADSARDVVDSMSDIVWAIDPRRDDLRNVVFRVRQFASDLLSAKGISWTLQAPAEFDKVKLNPQQRRHMFLIFKEAISNSARHADCKSVWLSLAIVHNQIIAEIRDDGRGLAAASGQAAANGRGGHGLINMRSRATQLGGEVIIDSPTSGGTNIRLIVPLKLTTPYD
ncbi:MAG TPA: two-component regulator propeller domain-containing protein [Blastocatellia bacterium]|nr:two-component regulator propeller domain-containing protein [Blastocatellia bacterium]